MSLSAQVRFTPSTLLRTRPDSDPLTWIILSFVVVNRCRVALLFPAQKTRRCHSRGELIDLRGVETEQRSSSERYHHHGRALGGSGAEVAVDESGALCMSAAELSSRRAPYELVKTMRASILVMGPLLARFGRAEVSFPGGAPLGVVPSTFI